MSAPGRGAGRCLDLEAVVDPRVVAGGDDDAGRRAALDDLVRAHLGRHGADREGDRDVVREEDLGRGHREVLGREPAVVGDDDALGGLAALDDVGGHAVGAAADVVVGELVGDPGAPAVGPEHDRGRRGRLPGKGHVDVLRFGAALEELLDERAVRGGPAQDRDRLGGGHATALGRGDDAESPADPPDDEVVVLDLDPLPGLDDRARSRARRAPRAAPTTTRDPTSRRPSSPSRPGRSAPRPP